MSNFHLEPSHTALVIVDVQNDFCHEKGAKALRGTDMTAAQTAAAVIEKIVERARKAGVPIVFVQTTHCQESSSEAWLSRPHGPRESGRPDVVQKGSWGAEFYRVLPQADDIIVEKHRYSAFVGTNLDDELRKRGIKSLLFTGVVTNVCVESTARHGFMLDYHVALIRDGCAGYGQPELEEATFRNIASGFGLVVSADEVIDYWSK